MFPVYNYARAFVDSCEREIVQRRDRNDKATSDRFKTVRLVGYKTRIAKDALIFGSIGSQRLFMKAEKPFTEFRGDGLGLPLFAVATPTLFRKRLPPKAYLCIFRYELLQEDELPLGTDYALKGSCNGLYLFKVPYCTVYLTQDFAIRKKRDKILKMIITEGKETRTFEIVRKYGERNIEVFDGDAIIFRWHFKATGDVDGCNSIFTIRSVGDFGKDGSSVAYDSTDAPVGFFYRNYGKLYKDELEREFGSHLVLGERDPPGYNEFEVPWNTKFHICVSAVVNQIEFGVAQMQE